MGNFNIGYKYYKRYFLGDQVKINKEIEEYKFNKENTVELLGIHRFNLETTYPGLLIGSGYNHEYDGDDAYKLGFFFDYTSGQPIIPGSSVKGILRSAFPDGGVFSEFKYEYIKDLCKEVLEKELEDDEIDSLKEEIFEGKIIEDKDLKSPLSNEYRDIFFDAIMTGAPKNGKFLGEDYIACHKDELKNPKPVKFLKVLPKVEFTFDFRLKDSIAVDITAEEKCKLFKAIILDLGVGSKTNVGYGRLIEK